MVKQRITTLVLLFISIESKAIQFPEDTVGQPKFILKITEAVTRKCRLSDSASEKFYTILKENILLLGKCRGDSIASIQTCGDIIKKMENDILQKFGKDTYDVYYQFAHPCRFPRYDPNVSKTERMKIF